MSAVFSGKYHSQLTWTLKKHPLRTKLWPHDDPSIRVPELLDEAGVRTINGSPYWGLRPDFGVTKGMKEQLPTANKWAPAQFRATEKRLAQLDDDERAFFYLHLGEPHAPYDRGGRKGTAHERYHREVEIVGREILTLEKRLSEMGLAERTLLIVTSDHGEAFGEHNSKYHARTVYDEALRVPLLLRMPALAPRSIDTPVSIIDLGPTILDLFGEATPGSFMGQSLVPLLTGEKTSLDRPIVFDSWGRALGMIFPDGMKLIVDPSKGTRELYDVTRDPEELDNLFDDRADARWRLDILRAFFQRHGMKPPEQYAY